MFLGVHLLQCMTGMYDTKVCSCITRTQLRAVQTGMYYPIYSKIWKGQRIYNSERNLDVTQCCGNVLTSTRWRVREQVKFRMDNLVLGRHPPWRPSFLWVSDKLLRYVRDNEDGLGVKLSFMARAFPDKSTKQNANKLTCNYTFIGSTNRRGRSTAKNMNNAVEYITGALPSFDSLASTSQMQLKKLEN